MPDYVVTTRNVQDDRFGSEPGPTRWLRVPDGATPSPAHEARSKKEQQRLVDEIMTAAGGGPDAQPEPDTGEPPGDLLVYVHGYNNSVQDVINRHRSLRGNLRQAGYQGEVLSFDWPSGSSVLAYLEDRLDAKAVAVRLVTDLISVFAARTSAAGRCMVNVHALGHSTGAFVIREACDDADDRRSLSTVNWMLSQIALIAADISASSMQAGESASRSMLAHCMRLTNYSNPRDGVLNISNAKRVGLSPRLGRVGLPPSADAKTVNVDCGPYFDSIPASDKGLVFQHSWHFTDATFALDLALTLRGSLDRRAIPTRRVRPDGAMELAPPRA